MSAINKTSNINLIINDYSKIMPTSNKNNIKDLLNLLEFRNLLDRVRFSTVKVINTNDNDREKVKNLYEKLAQWFQESNIDPKKILESVKKGEDKASFLLGYKLTLFFDFCYRIKNTYSDDKNAAKMSKEMSKHQKDIDELLKNYVDKQKGDQPSVQDEFKKIYTIDSEAKNKGVEIFPSLLVRTAEVYSQLNKTRNLYTDKKVNSVEEFDKIINNYIQIINSNNLKALEKSEEFKQIVSQSGVKTELTKFLHQLLQENTSVNFTKSFTDKHLKDYLDAIKSNTEYQHDNIKKSIENSQTLQVVGEKFFKVESYLDKNTDYDPLAKYNTFVSENISTFNKVAKDLNNAGDIFFNAEDSDLTDNAFLQYGCLKLAQAHLKALDKLPGTIDTKNIVKPDTANLKKIDEKLSDLEKRITELEDYYNKNLKDKDVSEFTPAEKEKINTYLQDNKKYWQLLEYLKGLSLTDWANGLNEEVTKIKEENSKATEKDSLKISAKNYQKALENLTPIISDYAKYGLSKDDLPTLSKEIQDILDSDDSNDPDNPQLEAALVKLKTALENLLGKMQKKAKANADKGYGQRAEVEKFDPIIQNAQDFAKKLDNIKDIIDTQSTNKDKQDQLAKKINNYKRAYERLKKVSGNSKYGLAEFVPVLPDTLAKAFDQDKNNDPTAAELENAFRTAETSIETALNNMQEKAERNKNNGYGGDNLDSFNPDIQPDASDAAKKIDEIIKVIDSQEIKKLEKQNAEQARQKKLATNFKNAYEGLAKVAGKPEYGLEDFTADLPEAITNYLDTDNNNDPSDVELNNAFAEAERTTNRALKKMKNKALENKNAGYGGGNLEGFNPVIQDDASDAADKIKQLTTILDLQENVKKAKEEADQERAKLFQDVLKAYDNLRRYDEPDDGDSIKKIPDVKIDTDGDNKPESWPDLSAMQRTLPNETKGNEVIQKVDQAIIDLVKFHNTQDQADPLPQSIDGLKDVIVRKNSQRKEDITREDLVNFVVMQINNLKQKDLIKEIDGFIKTIDLVPQYNFPVLASMYTKILEYLAAGKLELDYSAERDSFFAGMVEYLKSWGIDDVDNIHIDKTNSKKIVVTCNKTQAILNQVKGIFANFEKAGLVGLLNRFDQWQYKDGQVIANKQAWDYALNDGRLLAELTLENITRAYARYNEITGDQDKFKQLIPEKYQKSFKLGIKQKLATLSYLLLENRESVLHSELTAALEKIDNQQSQDFLALLKKSRVSTAIYKVVVEKYYGKDETLTEEENLARKQQWQNVFQKIDLPQFIEKVLRYNTQKLIFNRNLKANLVSYKDTIMPTLDIKDAAEFKLLDKEPTRFDNLSANVVTYHDNSLKNIINQLAVIYPYINTQLSHSSFDFTSNLKILGVTEQTAASINGERKVTYHLYNGNLVIQASDLNKVLYVDNVVQNIMVSITKDQLEALGLTAKQIEKYSSVAKQNKSVYIFNKSAKTSIYQDLLKKSTDLQTFNALLKLLNYYQAQELNQPVYLTLDQKGQHYLSYVPMDPKQDVCLNLGQVFDEQMIDHNLTKKLTNSIIVSSEPAEQKKFAEYFLAAVKPEDINNVLNDQQIAIFFDQKENKLYLKQELADPQIFKQALSLAGIADSHSAFEQLLSIRDVYLKRLECFEFNRGKGELFLKARPDRQELQSLKEFMQKNNFSVASSNIVAAITNFNDYNFLSEDYLQIIDQVNDEIFQQTTDIRDLLIKPDTRNYDPILDLYTGYYDSKNPKINSQNNALGDNRRLVALAALVAFVIARAVKNGRDRNEMIDLVIKILGEQAKQWWGRKMLSDDELNTVKHLLQQSHLPKYGFSDNFNNQQIKALIYSHPEFKSLFTGLLSVNKMAVDNVANLLWNNKIELKKEIEQK